MLYICYVAQLGYEHLSCPRGAKNLRMQNLTTFSSTCRPTKASPIPLKSAGCFQTIILVLEYRFSFSLIKKKFRKMDFSISTLASALPFVVRSSRRRRRMTPHMPQRNSTTSQTSIQQRPIRTNRQRESLVNRHRDSLLVYLEHAYKATVGQNHPHQQPQLSFLSKEFHSDDDTASTLSTSGEDKIVTFSSPLVTNIHTRPRTSKEDKYYLHYSERDYMDFRYECITGKQRTRRVSFARNVVSDVHEVQKFTSENKSAMYYSETELQE